MTRSVMVRSPTPPPRMTRLPGLQVRQNTRTRMSVTSRLPGAVEAHVGLCPSHPRQQRRSFLPLVFSLPEFVLTHKGRAETSSLLPPVPGSEVAGRHGGFGGGEGGGGWPEGVPPPNEFGSPRPSVRPSGRSVGVVWERPTGRRMQRTTVPRRSGLPCDAAGQGLDVRPGASRRAARSRERCNSYKRAADW